jgi:asparagine synthase (glutamine-hydrolysing)
MSPRYLLLLGKEGPPARALVERLAARTGLIALYASGRLVALVNTACGCISLGESGCILGWLFHRHGPAQRLASLTEIDAAHVVRSEGEALLRMFWGGYVAAIAGADSLVLRDPSGTFPCYYVTDGELVFIASDADLLALAGIPIDLELEEVGRQLYRAFVPSQATAMRGVRELLAGFALRLSSTAERQQPCWRPWDHVQEASSRATDGSAERFSRVIQHSVAAWASESGRLLLSVSGGLDSSIIAACLARARTDTVCLTMFSNDPAGDERAYARTLCNHLGLPLIERPYRLEDIDITEPLAAHLPRPRDRTQANAYERVHIEVASEIGAGAFVTGNGGDHVLGYSQSAAPIADRYLVEGLGAGVVRSLRDVCRQTGCSIFDALWQAWRLAHSSPHRPIVPNPLFLDEQFIASVKPTEMHHPWLDAPPDALPGKAAHISTILRVQPNLEASRGAVLPVFSPLVSQPVIEACLSIPSWEWRAGGRDRSLARRAFAGALPAAIVNRRVKGTPSRFAARLLDHFRAQIRDRVLRGRLAANGVVDRAALGLALAGERPVGDLERVRILEIVNAEAWLDHWAARKSSESAEPQVRSGGHGRTPSSTCPTP